MYVSQLALAVSMISLHFEASFHSHAYLVGIIWSSQHTTMILLKHSLINYFPAGCEIWDKVISSPVISFFQPMFNILSKAGADSHNCTFKQIRYWNNIACTTARADSIPTTWQLQQSLCSLVGQLRFFLTLAVGRFALVVANILIFHLNHIDHKTSESLEIQTCQKSLKYYLPQR